MALPHWDEMYHIAGTCTCMFIYNAIPPGHITLATVQPGPHRHGRNDHILPVSYVCKTNQLTLIKKHVQDHQIKNILMCTASIIIIVESQTLLQINSTIRSLLKHN